jgi:cyclic pyranopterin phosphate synthase
MARPFSIPLAMATPAVSTAHGSSSLVDSFGRVHNNLRISVTDRCNLRCTYCMPEDVTFFDKSELLTFEEIARFVRCAVPLGVDKLRLTGGEPLMRRELSRLVRMLKEVEGIADLSLTTNGVLLAQYAAALFDAGLRRLNISLDTLDPARFRQLARRDGLDDVLAGIAQAKRVGFARIKINAVSIRGVTEHEVAPLARFARSEDLELRFIEYMPIGAEPWERDKVYFASEILEQIEEHVAPLIPASQYDPRAPAMEFEYTDTHQHIGIIASVSRPFCRSCNRLRLTADGKLRNCLFALSELDVKPLLRDGSDVGRIQELIRQNVAEKWEGHEINQARFIKPARTMHAIGG